MPTKWYQGEIVKIKESSPTVKNFFLKIKSDDPFVFKAGQFITIDLPVAQKRLGRWRSYSIANHPNNDNLIELCIVRLDGGAGTKYLFEDVVVGEELKFKGPDGNFCLPENIEKDIVMICTGTGVAPFRSMIQDLIQNQKNFKKIDLIFGTRFKSGILYREEFEKLSQEEKRFTYDVALSRETSKEDHIHDGYIHPIYMSKFEEKREDVVFYICGWSKMIDAVANFLLKLGYDKNQIIYELYG